MNDWLKLNKNSGMGGYDEIIITAESANRFRTAKYKVTNYFEDETINIMQRDITSISTIEYRTSNGRIIDIDEEVWGFPIASNTYEDGIGRLSFYGTLTKIPAEGFKYTAITEIIKLPDTIVTIGASAFWRTDLESINFNEGLKYIGTSAFEKTRLTTLNFPLSLRRIGNYAFADNNKLRGSIDLKNVYYIGSYAFREQEYITEFIISSLLYMGTNWFIITGQLYYGTKYSRLQSIVKSGIDNQISISQQVPKSLKLNNFKFTSRDYKGYNGVITCPQGDDYSLWETTLTEQKQVGFDGTWSTQHTLPPTLYTFSRDKEELYKKGGTLTITTNTSNFVAEVIGDSYFEEEGEEVSLLTLTKEGNKLMVTAPPSTEAHFWHIGFYIDDKWYIQDITQHSYDEIRVEPTELNVAQSGGLDNIAYFDIISDTSWTIYTYDTWFSIGGSGDEHPERGSGNARRSLICEPNTDEYTRLGYLYITANDGTRITLKICQKGTAGY